ncbi:MAG: hypothetical protein NVSMB27_27210 [Ktedonobacteraceae bacterium]
MPDRVGQQSGNYRLLRLLGRGGFAEVYLGEHVYLRRRAAIKVLHTSLEDEDVNQFLAEAQILGRLTHPNIVQVFDYAVEQGIPFLAMDYALHGTLRQRHPRGSCLSLATTVAYVKQVAAALQYAHNHQVIHRDVKPENMLLGLDQQVLLSDFGISLWSPSPEQLSTQEMAGTLPYMAPEQIRGKPSFASDQYALGIVAYEWLCGRRPFEGPHWQIAYQHMSDPPPLLREKDPSLPAAAENVILKALAKDPKDRYASVQLFAQALERASGVSSLDPRSDTEVTARLGPISTVIHKRVFVSASHADATFVARLIADLQQRGITAYHEDLDRTQHTLDREDVMHEEIRAVDVMLLVVSPHAHSLRTIKEHLRIANLYQRRLVFVWVAGEEITDILPKEWGITVQIDLVDARERCYESALDELVTYIGQEDTIAMELSLPESACEPRNPYKGLRAFTQNDVTDFFGRDRLIEELVDRMKSMLTSGPPGTPTVRLLAVIGPSGSGKSSVVMAGLLPQLQRGVLPGSQEWVYLEPMVPGTHSLEALALTLAPHLPDRSVKSLREDLEEESARGLHLLTTQLVKAPGQKVVLLIDQFEELFTLTTSEEERQHLIDLLVTAVMEPHGWVMVLLTLRADFYDRPLSYPSLSQLIVRQQIVVEPMDVHDLRAVIKRPAMLPDVQLGFEGSLVGDLLFDVQGQAGALPLLQFTLEQLFERRSGHTLTLQAYQEIGGVKGALAKHAEDTYRTLPSEEHRRLARALFLRLIDPGVTEQDTTRRRAVLRELSLPDSHQTTLLQEIAAVFIAARLLTANEIAGITTLEVSHEALIREWPRLAGWLREARDDIRLQQAISKDAAGWELRDKPGDRLYRGSQLKEARAWARRNIPSEQETVFLRAGTTRGIRSIAGVMVVVLLLLSSTGLASWLYYRIVNPPTLALVNTTNDDGPGSLRKAIAVASPGSPITFDTSLRGQTIMLTSGDLQIARNLTIRGLGAGLLSISSESGCVIRVAKNVFVTISGLTFKDSKTYGGFINNNSTLTLSNSTIAGNRARGPSVTAGGIRNHYTLTLINSTVSGNTSRDAGGIYNDGTLTLINSTVSGNTTTGSGGGIHNLGTLTLTNSTVSGNKASSGGGIAISEGTNNNTDQPTSAMLLYCTVYGNIADVGGGIWIDNLKQQHLVTMRASIVAGNNAHTDSDIAGSLTTLGYNLVGDRSAAMFLRSPNMQSTDKVGVSFTDLKIDPTLQDNGGTSQPHTWTHALLPGSPAIDFIPSDVCMSFKVINDQHGVKRPRGKGCDDGAYEYSS